MLEAAKIMQGVVQNWNVGLKEFQHIIVQSCSKKGENSWMKLSINSREKKNGIKTGDNDEQKVKVSAELRPIIAQQIF